MLVSHCSKAIYKVSVRRYPGVTRIFQVEFRDQLDKYVEGLEKVWRKDMVKVEFLGHLTTIE